MRPLMEFWSARRILKQLCDADRRKAVLTSFWEGADPHAQARALIELSRVMHFRPGSLKKASAERKAELLSSRLSSADFEDSFEIALMVYHTREKRELLAAFLDYWKIPHEDGSIEVEDYNPPEDSDVASAIAEMKDRFETRDIAIYLASAGLLMGNIPRWRESTWPAVDRLVPELSGA